MCVCVCVCVCMLSHVWLFVNPWTSADQTPLSMEFFQARILEWVSISFSRRSSTSRDRTWDSYISCTGGWILYHKCHLGSPEMWKGKEKIKRKTRDSGWRSWIRIWSCVSEVKTRLNWVFGNGEAMWWPVKQLKSPQTNFSVLKN